VDTHSDGLLGVAVVQAYRHYSRVVDSQPVKITMNDVAVVLAVIFIVSVLVLGFLGVGDA